MFGKNLQTNKRLFLRERRGKGGGRNWNIIPRAVSGSSVSRASEEAQSPESESKGDELDLPSDPVEDGPND